MRWKKQIRTRGKLTKTVTQTITGVKPFIVYLNKRLLNNDVIDLTNKIRLFVIHEPRFTKNMDYKTNVIFVTNDAEKTIPNEFLVEGFTFTVSDYKAS